MNEATPPTPGPGRTPPDDGPQSAPEETQIAFVLKMALALHRFGTPAHRLEQLMRFAATRFGLEGRFFSSPTALFASFGPPAALRTAFLRAEPGEIDLERISLLDRLVSEVLRGTLSPQQGAEAIDAVLAAPRRYPRWMHLAAHAVVAGTTARLFGGGPRELGFAAAIGFIVGLLAWVGDHRRSLSRVLPLVSAMVVSSLTVLAGWRWGPLNTGITMLSGVVAMLPGLALTTAITEIASRHLISGAARLVGVAGVFLQLGFGVALGNRLEDVLPPLRHAVSAASKGLPAWTLWPALLFSTVGLAVTFKARLRDLGWILGAGAIAYLGSSFGARVLGPQLGAFVGAFALGAASNAFARLLERPAMLLMVPGLTLLVPGSMGFQSLESLIEQDVVGGMNTAFSMVLVAVALAAGLLFSNTLVPAGREL